MRFFTALVASAAYLTVALAQVNIAFTSVPAVVSVGQEYNITWGGGDGFTPVTITLRRGDPRSLETISTLTSTGANGYYLWTPDSSLPTASDYALQITQGQSDINYSGPFALVGGTGSSSISYSGTTTLTSTISTNFSMTIMTSSGSSTGTGIPISRNTTFSSQTLASTSSGSRTSTREPTTAGSATVTAATTAPTGGSTQVASSLALILGVVVAMAFLN